MAKRKWLVLEAKEFCGYFLKMLAKYSKRKKNRLQSVG
jgi:hypothetical protein